MKTIALMSTDPKTGKTTVAVNLAFGLMKAGHKVLIWNLSKDDFLYRWLDINKESLTGDNAIHTITNRMGFDVLVGGEFSNNLKEYISQISTDYDYLLLDTDTGPESLNAAKLADIVIVCTDLSPEDPENLAVLDRKLQDMTSGQAGINLVVPCKIKVGEWENNTKQLIDIADRIGYEKIADLIPE
ncbi:MAG: hypothetical protein H5T98_05770 [Syntrophomonadaceae bacterium]|nr:hypothetical protein [Syntrophomonadaceae bacterium]